MTVREHRIDSEVDRKVGGDRAVQQVSGAEPASVARATSGV